MECSDKRYKVFSTLNVKKKIIIIGGSGSIGSSITTGQIFNIDGGRSTIRRKG